MISGEKTRRNGQRCSVTYKESLITMQFDLIHYAYHIVSNPKIKVIIYKAIFTNSSHKYAYYVYIERSTSFILTSV